MFMDCLDCSGPLYRGLSVAMAVLPVHPTNPGEQLLLNSLEQLLVTLHCLTLQFCFIEIQITWFLLLFLAKQCLHLRVQHCRLSNQQPQYIMKIQHA